MGVVYNMGEHIIEAAVAKVGGTTGLVRCCGPMTLAWPFSARSHITRLRFVLPVLFSLKTC